MQLANTGYAHRVFCSRHSGACFKPEEHHISSYPGAVLTQHDAQTRLIRFLPKQGSSVQAGHRVNTVTKLSSGSECWQGKLTSAVEPGQSESLSAQCGRVDCV